MHIIGIVGRVYQNKDGQDIIQTHDAVRKMLASREDVVCITLLPTENMNYLENTEGTDIVNKAKLTYVLDKCDGFIVPGGTYFYRFDEYVINYAIRNDKPLLAICLGFQAMCSLYAKSRPRFDMTNKLHNDNHYADPTNYAHNVILKKNTLLKEIIDKDEIPVNSVHHDIVNFAMDQLKVNAISKDGIVEGVEYPGKKFILGLQWHPEYIRDENTKRIVDRFIEELDK